MVVFPLFHFFDQRSLPETKVLVTRWTIEVENRMCLTKVAETKFNAFSFPSTVLAGEVFLLIRKIVDLHIGTTVQRQPLTMRGDLIHLVCQTFNLRLGLLLVLFGLGPGLLLLEFLRLHVVQKSPECFLNSRVC